MQSPIVAIQQIESSQELDIQQGIQSPQTIEETQTPYVTTTQAASLQGNVKLISHRQIYGGNIPIHQFPLPVAKGARGHIPYSNLEMGSEHQLDATRTPSNLLLGLYEFKSFAILISCKLTNGSSHTCFNYFTRYCGIIKCLG